MKKIILYIALFAITLFGFFECMTNPYTNQPAELDAEEAREAAIYYKDEISWYEQNGWLWTDTELGQFVVEIGNNLIAAAKQWEHVNNKGKTFVLRHNNKWEINFVYEPEWNAWCTAGGKICVFSGIFTGPTALQSPDELAALLGHEIAHALLFHRKRKKK